MSQAEAEMQRDLQIEHWRHVLRSRSDEDEDEDEVREALEALATIGDAASHATTEVMVHATSRHLAIRTWVVRALGAMMPEVVARAIADAVAVPAFRARGVAVLCELATDKLLWPMHHDARVAPLSAALRDQVALVDRLLAEAPAADGYEGGRMLQAAAFLAPGDARVLAALEVAAGSPDAMRRRQVPEAAQHVGAAAVPVLARLASDVGEADEAAVHALARIATPAAITALRRIARTAKGEIQRLARERIPKPKPRAKR